MVQHFQHRWKREYLTSLREQHRTTGNNEQSVKVGDVVLVYDEIPRTRWKMAVVMAILEQHRSDNYGEGRKTNRPIEKLYPLQVMSSCNNEVTETEKSTTTTATSNVTADMIPALQGGQLLKGSTEHGRMVKGVTLASPRGYHGLTDFV